MYDSFFSDFYSGSEATTPRSTENQIMDLPHDIVQVIMRHMAVDDILRFGATSRTLRELALDNSLWQALVLRDYGVSGTETGFDDDSCYEYVPSLKRAFRSS
jgi:hypothetical protein